MNTNSNLYTFLYASILVIIVAAILAFTAVTLQPLQKKNIRVEKMQNILKSVGIDATVENAEELYSKNIKQDMIVNTSGEKTEGKGFDVNMKKEGKTALKIKAINIKLLKANKAEKKVLNTELTDLKSKLKLPVYVCEKEGKTFYIFPQRGKGLWGPIWGYISLEEDFNTINGAVFDHKGETPGLGAEIAQSWFSDPFKGKTIFEGDEFVSITAHKGGKDAAKLAGDLKHGVDAISGGTITSKGLEAMIKEDWFFNYGSYIKKNKK